MGFKTETQWLNKEFGGNPPAAPSIGYLTSGTERTAVKDVNVYFIDTSAAAQSIVLFDYLYHQNIYLHNSNVVLQILDLRIDYIYVLDLD